MPDAKIHTFPTEISLGRCHKDPSDTYSPLVPIRWRALERQAGRTLVISQTCLDVHPYHTSAGPVTWAGCDLRAWMNEALFQEIFSPAERAMVALTELDNPDNPDFGTSGGGTTLDWLFPLSIGEVFRYLTPVSGPVTLSDRGRLRRYAVNGGGLSVYPTWVRRQRETAAGQHIRASWYWLRSPGATPASAAFVSESDELYTGGFHADAFGLSPYSMQGAVRPAMWLKLPI